MRSQLVVFSLLAVFVFAAACDDGSEDESFRAAPAVKGEHLFVVGNGIACFTAPCPSFTAINDKGDVIELSNVTLPDGTSAEQSTALGVGGLEVKGIIKK